MNELFSNQILELAEKDLSVREKLASEGQLSGGYHPEMEQVHKENAAQLREIIEKIGFPTISKVGAEASDAAWLIIQHSIGEPEFMKWCCQLMIENSDDIKPSNIAYLHDRIQFFQGEPQRYGTQMMADGLPYPVENKNRLNAERRKVNLMPFSQEKINAIPDPENIPEIDRKDADYTAWRIKTGWLPDFE
ncbi:DUF6624 domain-containing protein [Chryseobacterium phocaeense]|uniref:DUF6624 domain-containing protein n=1 Tax=Chryseobacterium phocaeense TaxID=1816690 RepID=UPI0009BB87CC|nr:DUF6624 domain-containing protein [Chryseobacterium phocaeense]